MMLRRLISFALQQRVFVILLILVLIGFGCRAIGELPIEAFPDVQDVQVQVITQFPGQAPEEVERSVTLPIERGMSGVPHMTQLRSVSMTGLSVVTLTFSDRTDDYFARQQVSERLAGLTLPANAQPSLAPLSTAVGEIYRYILDAPASMPRADVRAVQDWLIEPALKTVAGVADVTGFGGSIREYQVNVDPAQLRRYGLTLGQVSQALVNASSSVGAGVLRSGDEAFTVRSVGIFSNLEDIGHAVIQAGRGAPVLVGDVAQVVVGEKQRAGIVAFNDRDDVVEGIVLMTKGHSAAQVVADLELKIAALNAQLVTRAPGVQVRSVYKRTDLIRHTVHTVAENLIIGAGLVIAILILFLRNWRAALIVASVIPLALLFAFILMDLRGVSANLISLGAVDFGIIIDSAVVLTEALMVRLALGDSDGKPQHRTYAWRVDVLKSTAVKMGHPILFAKAIIILAFLPIFTFQRVEGKIFTPVALTLSFALLGALLLTLTWVPTLLSYAIRRPQMSEKHSHWMSQLQERYRGALLMLNRHRRVTLAVSVSVLVIALGAAPWLGSEFLPKLDEGNIWLTVTLPAQTSLEKTKQVEGDVRAVLRAAPQVGDIISQVGRPDDGTDAKGPNNMEVLADIRPRERWPAGDIATKEDLLRALSAKLHRIPGLPTNFSQVIEDNVEESLSGVKGEVSVKIAGPDLEVLEEKGNEVAAIIADIRGASDVATVRIGGQAEVDIVPDRSQLARFGLNMGDLNTTIQTALGGSVVNAMYEGERRFDVTLRLGPGFRDSVEAIGRLGIAVPGQAGLANLSLSDLARVGVKEGAARINREGGERVVAVKMNILDRDQGSFVTEARQRVAEAVVLPAGYSLTWGGQFENQTRAMKRLGIIVPISLLMIFLLLFWAFRSVSHAFLVLAMLPFALIGGVAALALAGLHLSVSAAVGFIAVAGISVQNGVIMIERMLEIVQQGGTLAVAMLEGAVDRLRPVLMTALMAGLGLIPAALSHGIGSETQRPFAVVIVGGIVSATVFTLLLLPVAFQMFARDIDAVRPAVPADDAAAILQEP